MSRPGRTRCQHCGTDAMCIGCRHWRECELSPAIGRCALSGEDRLPYSHCEDYERADLPPEIAEVVVG